jgi:signal transduction histidine kinase/ligand-binding sensor domain-containing protein
VYSLFEDDEGYIWSSTSPEYLNKYNPATRSFSHYSFQQLIDHPANLELAIISMCDDHKGRIYMAAWAQYANIKPGLLFYDKQKDKIESFATPDSLEIQNVYNVLADKSGNIWILSINGLFKIDADRKLSKVNVFEKIIPKDKDGIYGIICDDDGQIWIVSWLGKLFKFNQETEKYICYTPDNISFGNKNDLHFLVIAADKKDGIWIASNKGLLHFNKTTEQFSLIGGAANVQLEQTQINKLIIDSFGTLWIATNSKGLFKYEEKALLKSYSYDVENKNSITAGWANHIYETKDGKIWITTSGQGTASGISEVDFRTGIVHSMSYNDFLPGTNIIFGLMEVGPDEFNISTENGQYDIFPKQKLKKKISFGGVPDSAFIYRFMKDDRENTWLCTYSGLFRKSKNEKAFRRYDLSKVKGGSAGSNEISDAFISKKHGLWLETNDGLFLYKYDTDKIERHGYDKKAGDIFVTQDINSFYEDSGGIAWVGTWQGGLSKYNVETEKIKTFTRNDGLPSMSVQGILPDEENNSLWLSTFDGLSRFNYKTGQFNNYSIADGIQSQLFSDGSYLKTSDGRFVFGGSNGITVFTANDVNTNSAPPRVFLTDFRLFNKSVLPGDQSVLKTPIYETKEITLAYEQNNISIEFMALHYSNPAKNKCAYILENYDDEWREVGNQHVASYPMLPPGEYIFRVKAANNNGVWNELGTSVKIIINPPWWKTRWAYALYFLIFALAIFAADRYFRNRVIQKERERNRVRELEQAREIEKAYTELKATQSQLIQSEKMASLGELTAGIAHEIQNPLNFVNNFSEINTELIDEMQLEMDKGNLADAKTISNDIKDNEQKINHHGKRADAIVKGMLQHSRNNSGLKEPTDINALADEYLRLAYHGLRAKDKSFNATLKTDFDETIGKINIIPQDIGRVVLNLITNAFYAVAEKKSQQPEGYEPTVSVSTKRVNGKVEIKVSDNGNGIPQKILEKIFQPFFTTKPAGQGTGLGLSLAYDIVKTHGGELKVETKEKAGSEFIIYLNDDGSK